MGSSGTLTRGERKPPATRRGKVVAWLTLMIPVELADRLVHAIEATNSVRPVDRRFVSKSSFVIACIEDGLNDAEQRLGIVSE